MSATPKPARLPPLKKLRVRNPGGVREQPCMTLMSSNNAGCVQLEQALRTCMDTTKKQRPPRSEVNYHLGRFKDRLTFAGKKGGRKVKGGW
ncbi:mitochondrial ribosomal protein 10 [Xylariaceae sp. FL0804]|nr:mitochondrial ribosomal protein 10 [Xylariaceae sp. FL0804]